MHGLAGIAISLTCIKFISFSESSLPLDVAAAMRNSPTIGSNSSLPNSMPAHGRKQAGRQVNG
jgi:hypothetical protein